MVEGHTKVIPMKPFDQAWILLKQQGRVRRGFGNSPFPRGRTPMQELDQQRRDTPPNPAAGPTATIGTSYDELQRVYAKLMSGEVLTPEETMALQQAERQPL